ncbi:hypothetical protein D4R86_05740 [bacterium]|nr:MAG: hypothetical protein D4R86_05740 [bacterium]
MAVSSIAGVDQGGVKLTCILYEGISTVTSVVHGQDGYYDKGITFASPLVKDAWVVPSVDSGNSYVETQGLPVVKAISNGSLILGKIISEPRIVVAPSSTPTATWAAHLTGKYYRVATVWFPGIIGTTKIQVQGLDAANIVPGVQATLEFDASGSVAAIAASSPDPLYGSDVTTGGVGVVSFHYVAAGTALVSALVGFTGGVNLIIS